MGRPGDGGGVSPAARTSRVREEKLALGEEDLEVRRDRVQIRVGRLGDAGGLAEPGRGRPGGFGFGRLALGYRPDEHAGPRVRPVRRRGGIAGGGGIVGGGQLADLVGFA